MAKSLVYMMKQGNISVDLSTEPPAKYQRLVEAAQAGLRTPSTLLLTDPTVSIDAFLASFSIHTQFIVRSANKTEDGSGHSLAGHFWSSAAVSAEQLPATIQTAWAENQALLASLQLDQLPILMLQEYIQHDWGGVLFYPWSFFSEYAYLEYSKLGVQQVVAGQAQAALIALPSSIPSPLPLAPNSAFLEPLLRHLVHQLRAAFSFPVDCEWAYSPGADRLVVLQVRAQTHAINSLLALPEDCVRAKSNAQFTALSASLGKLSPLSFSLLERLYQQSIPDLQRLGCRAEQVNFLDYQVDGTVLVEPSLEQQFYAATLLGGFWRGFRANEFKAKAEAALASFDATQAFSSTQLARLFSAWLLQNILQAGEGREDAPPIHAYELSWLNPAESLVIAEAAHLNLKLRNAFLQELNKLKQALAAKKYLVFCNWDEYCRQDDSKALERQHAAARLAIYDYALTNSSAEFQSLAANVCVRGTVFNVPITTTQQPINLPTACIWVSAYFDNRWVQLIPKLTGIVVLQGSRLAHSAIVAREYNIPYVVVSPAQFAELDPGLLIELDARQAKISLLTT